MFSIRSNTHAVKIFPKSFLRDVLVSFSRVRRTTIPVFAALLGLCLTTDALRGDFVFFVGPGAISPEENISFNGPGNIGIGITVTGQTNKSSTLVEFTNNDVPQEAQSTPAMGQARIEAVDGAYSSIILAASRPDVFFTELEFNVNILNGRSGTFTLEIIDQDGNSTFDTFAPNTLGNGQNFFAVQAFNGKLIDRAILTASGEIIQDIRQVRVSTVAVPEPATGIMFVAGVAGMFVARRRVRGAGFSTVDPFISMASLPCGTRLGRNR